MPDLVGASWRKSTHSGSNGCVEVAFVDGLVAIRDTKDRQGHALIFTPVEWHAFIDGVRDGQFDLERSTERAAGGRSRARRVGGRRAEPAGPASARDALKHPASSVEALGVGDDQVHCIGTTASGSDEPVATVTLGRREAAAIRQLLHDIGQGT
jgi:hypothetical protein